jgi:hypothetical protein
MLIMLGNDINHANPLILEECVLMKIKWEIRDGVNEQLCLNWGIDLGVRCLWLVKFDCTA